MQRGSLSPVLIPASNEPSGCEADIWRMPQGSHTPLLAAGVLTTGHKEEREMADKKLVEAITSMEEDFAQWYTDVVKKAELLDYTSIKGCMVSIFWPF